MFFFICVWINGWLNNREAGDLRRYRAHYDVIVMLCSTVDRKQALIIHVFINVSFLEYFELVTSMYHHLVIRKKNRNPGAARMRVASLTYLLGSDRTSRMHKTEVLLTQCYFGVYFPCCLAALHDDVIKWKHFPRYSPFVRGIHRSPVNSLHKGHWRGALIFSLICVWISGWENNRAASDLRRYRTHYDVIVMGKKLWNPAGWYNTL